MIQDATNNYVTFTEKSFTELQKRYNQAVENEELSFSFKGREYVTLYAKYVLQYLKLAGLGKR